MIELTLEHIEERLDLLEDCRTRGIETTEVEAELLMMALWLLRFINDGRA